MTKLMIDENTANKLRVTKDPVLLCDPAGQIVGRVVPPSLYDNVVIPFKEEELRQSEEDPEEYTLAEILAQHRSHEHLP